jgi:hypothetical protein
MIYNHLHTTSLIIITVLYTEYSHVNVNYVTVRIVYLFQFVLLYWVVLW